MTNLVTVKARLVALIEERPALTHIPVLYGAPQYAYDLTASDGQRSAIWCTNPPNSATARKEIPYMVAGSKPTREAVEFDVVAQAIVKGSKSTQLEADTRAVELMGEVETVLASDPSLGLTDPNPLAVQLTGWQQITLEPAANAKGCRMVLSVGYEADIAAP